jgi:hypothetical protein
MKAPMAEPVTNCPRCGACQITFDVIAANYVDIEYHWKKFHECFCVCRHCGRSTTFVLSLLKPDQQSGLDDPARIHGAINEYFQVERYISIRDMAVINPPAFLPKEIHEAFKEGATCMAVKCFNAAATMFRLCIDHATRSLLPTDDVNGLNAKIRNTLYHRLVWLFANNVLSPALAELSHCIREDGNDGAHAGTLSQKDAEDICDFTFALLERLYTEPEKLQLAQERRELRRTKKA